MFSESARRALCPSHRPEPQAASANTARKPAKARPCRRGEIKGLRERDKANTEGREFVQRRHQVD